MRLDVVGRDVRKFVYLLDTNVVSELRRPNPHKGVLNWIADVPAAQLFICSDDRRDRAGIEIVREQDIGKAYELEAWVGRVFVSYGVLQLDASAFREWARLKHR